MLAGICFKHLLPGQLSWSVISEVNRVKKERKDIDLALFVEEISPVVMPPLCGIFNPSEIYLFNDVLITTCVETTLMAIGSMKPNVYFYINDLEWLRRGKQDFFMNTSAYRHPSVKLIARSEDHRVAIENYANKPVAKVLEEFDLLEILKDELNS